jgi:hypothetical protein
MAGSPQHFTLVADTVTTCTFSSNFGRVEILNVDGAAAVYISTDGSAPVVGGTGYDVLPAAICSVEVADQTSGNTVVKLISAGTPKVSVRGL